MAKKITGKIKLQVSAGQANPAPPIGPALGQHGVNIMEFCKQFNAQTQSLAGLVVPVIITVYQDRSFTFVMKSPPASSLLKRAAGLAKGSGMPNRDKVGKVTQQQLSVTRPTASTHMPAATYRIVQPTGVADRSNGSRQAIPQPLNLSHQPRAVGGDHCGSGLAES